MANPDPTRPSLLGNRAVRNFEEKPVSEFPPINTDELMHRNFYVLKVAGEINVGQYGPSHVVEITTPEDTSIGHSWLVNKNSVLGRQLEDEVKKGGRAFPFLTSIEERIGSNGRMYVTFAAPKDEELPWDHEDNSGVKVSKAK